ncbi:hypothetical protein NQ317_017250 [Molorchus minor]|uniref:Uncharacterized protein n=1 Tax=Molorchus minor TaxID=1323400 RepID=A0ABQ9J104_9CUCU|nr:hypothetical protein NQ317_017250 [Molorchus minor]
MYLKSNHTKNYNYISTAPDDEEDILSKNSRELQIKRQDSTGSKITIEKHEIPTSSKLNEPGPSSSKEPKKEGLDPKRDWETFDDDDDDQEHESGNETNKYKIMKEEWETFDEDDEIQKPRKKEQWETFAENTGKNKDKPKNLQLELSFADASRENNPTSIPGIPTPLFSDLPVNNNNTYSYDVLEQQPEYLQRTAVFMPTTIERKSIRSSLEILQQPTTS